MKPKYKVVVYCSGCGFRLYEDNDGSTVKFNGIVSAAKVYEIHGGTCPVCGRKLSRKPLEVKFVQMKEYVDDGGGMGVVKLVLLSAKVPESYVKLLDSLVKAGLYTSRSEALRAAIRELLRKHYSDAEILKMQLQLMEKTGGGKRD